MANTIEIGGKNLLPISVVVRSVSYSRDYITRLAREGKIYAVHVGRQWYVDCDSLQRYVELSAVEADARKRLLSDERKRERELVQRIEQVGEQHSTRHAVAHYGALVATSLVLLCGSLFGYATYWLTEYPVQAQVAGGGFASSPASDTPTAPAISLPQRSAPAASIVTQATTTRQAIADPQQALVLLPIDLATSAAAFFSDPVQIRTATDSQLLFIKNSPDNHNSPEHEKTLGLQASFITVPVDHAD